MWAHKWISAALVATVAFLSYHSSLDGGFVFDDHRAILTNDDLDSLKTSLLDVLVHDFWGGHMTRVESHKSYRPLTVLTYRYLNYNFSQLQPYIYRLTNVLMHCLASVLFLFLSEIVLGENVKTDSTSSYTPSWATYTALLFAVHSIHTEAVASVVGRAEVLSCIFFLSSILLFVRAISVGNGVTLRSRSKTKWRLVLSSIVLSTCSMLSKEQGVMSIGMCVGFDILLHWDMVWSVLLRESVVKNSIIEVQNGTTHIDYKKEVTKNEVSTIVNGSIVETRGKKTGKGKHDPRSKEHMNTDSFKELVTRIVLLVVCGVMLLWFRLSMNYGSSPIFKPNELRATFHPNRIVRMLSFSNIYTLDVWLLLSPSSLCCDWSLGSVPLVTSIYDPRNIWSLLLYFSLAVFVIHVFRSKKDRLPVGTALGLLLLPFLPASGLMFKVGFVIAERVLYMPSLGMCLLVIIGMRRLSLYKEVLGSITRYYLVGVMVVMAMKTYRRNLDWASDIQLFRSGVQVLPMNVKMRNNYGMELKDRGRVEEARAQYYKSIETDPDYGEVYFNLGNLLSDENNYAEAAINFEKAIEYPQMYSKTLNNLATTYYRLRQLDKAEVLFKESIELSPDQATSYNNLASLYGETGRHKLSEETFMKALELNPTYTEAYFNLGTLCVQMKRLDEGEKYLRHALKLNPNHHGAANNLNVIHHHRKTRNQQKPR